jgi:hypothetical protein
MARTAADRQYPQRQALHQKLHKIKGVWSNQATGTIIQQAQPATPRCAAILRHHVPSIKSVHDKKVHVAAQTQQLLDHFTTHQERKQMAASERMMSNSTT